VRSQLNPGLMQVVWEWAKGTKFSDICLFTNVLEGSIVRCITRLDETCRDLRNAARVIGDAPLHAKMLKASELIKRSADKRSGTPAGWGVQALMLAVS